MISRYTRPEMAKIWQTENRFCKMRDVEVAVAVVQARNKIIPQKAAAEISRKAKFNVKRIEEIEAVTKHDVIAFVSSLAESVGDSGKFIHYGLTSSDVLDTALSLQIREASEALELTFGKFRKALEAQVKKHTATLCAGRTHGMHAEVTSFGLKLAGFLAEFRRHEERFHRAYSQCMVGKLSGAVGAYATLSPKIEREVCKLLKLKPETIATQVIPRDRLAELFSAFALLAGFIERLAIELRHLQRTEVNEVSESFTSGQKGSSAMPHKKNPISAENATGLARLLRSYSLPAFENMALWHERDISHSSVERVLLPDAFIVCDYIISRLTGVVSGLQVNKEQMKKNMELSQGQLFSSQVLLLLVKKGLSREEAYKIVQENSHGLKSGQMLNDKLMKDPRVQNLAKKSEIDSIFKESTYKQQMKFVVDRALRNKI